MSDYAAIVDKREADRVLEALRESGVYDTTRRISERDAETLEIPVVEPPESVDVIGVTTQTDPERRVSGLDDRLRERGWSEVEIGRAPRSWAVVGDVVLVRLPEDCPRPAEVGRALLDLQACETVLVRNGIAGPHREPDVEVLAGSGETEVVHVEAGTRYALDLAELMFSPGNQAERRRMGAVVAADETVLDMFAGIGYFALPMARAGAHVTAIERNPTAFRYLVENAPLNGVEDRLSPILGDCREVTAWFDAAEEPGFDRVVMGHYDALDHLEAAVAVASADGLVHAHAAVPTAELWDRPSAKVEAAAASVGRDVDCLERRRVKSYSEGVAHVVLDLRVR